MMQPIITYNDRPKCHLILKALIIIFQVQIIGMYIWWVKILSIFFWDTIVCCCSSEEYKTVPCCYGNSLHQVAEPPLYTEKADIFCENILLLHYSFFLSFVCARIQFLNIYLTHL